ncbi:MAG: PEP-CTERM sorting domain-containing protein [Bryobacteraceae bacterium]|jgi:hypothetical protein
MIYRVFALLAPMFLFTLQAVADPVIDYQLINLGTQTGGDPNYEYIYSIFNDGSLTDANYLEGGAPVQLFDIEFPTAFYANLVAVVPYPSAWSDQILMSVGSGVPADFDACSFSTGGCPTSGGGIAALGSLTGFGVDFTWLGPGSPGAQTFEITDPVSLTVYSTGTGMTALAAPEPSTFGMLGILFAFGACKIRRKHVQSVP